MAQTVLLPVRICGVPEWGMIAASCGTEPSSGSGVLLGGELASGDITILDFGCARGHTDTRAKISGTLAKLSFSV